MITLWLPIRRWANPNTLVLQGISKLHVTICRRLHPQISPSAHLPHTSAPPPLSLCIVEGPSACLCRLPSIARPYALDANWWDAFRQCLKRIVARLARVRISGLNGAG